MIMSKVCDSCIEALGDDGAPEGLESSMAIELGYMVGDHLCDEIESDGEIICRCSCHPRRRSKSNFSIVWKGKARDFSPTEVAELYQQSRG